VNKGHERVHKLEERPRFGTCALPRLSAVQTDPDDLPSLGSTGAASFQMYAWYRDTELANLSLACLQLLLVDHGAMDTPLLFFFKNTLAADSAIVGNKSNLGGGQIRVSDANQ
jgi:hypothetical protein